MSNQAIISGVNVYQYSPYDTLRGCVEDAQQFNLLAQNYLEFRPDGVSLFIDSMAEAARIRDYTWNRVTKSRGGNRILWTHSSHGTNETDPTQTDGFMELLCCYDTRKVDGGWDPDTVISAKFIGEVVDQVHPDDHMDIILDCCYAPEGSQLKAMSRSYSKARFLHSTVNIPEQLILMGKKLSKVPSNVCLWSACESHQTSADAFIDGKWQGAFSAAFRKFFKVGRSRADVIYYARRWLHENRFEQTCHLYGTGLAGQPMITP